MNAKLIFQIVLIFIFSQNVLAQDYPATEIYLLNIQKKGNGLGLADNPKLTNVSNNKGYDNQPYFIESVNSIAYVSSRNKKPTDVYLYNIKTGVTKQYTNTEEAEFSPKITPDTKYISVVKGAEQNLTRISLDGSVTEKLYTCKDSIGYYCWLNDHEIAAVVLTNPVSLKLINIKKKTEQYLADSIGRNLFSYNNGIVVCRTLHSGNWITYIDKKGNYTKWIQMQANSEDFWLTDDGWIFSSNGSSIVYCNVKDLNKGWQILADISGTGISKIFRLSVNKKKNMLAFVTEDK